jgi:hypothetical protein
LHSDHAATAEQQAPEEMVQWINWEPENTQCRKLLRTDFNEFTGGKS